MVMLASAPAEAVPSRVRFKIAPKACAEALIDLALQGDVSLLGAGACRGNSPALDGAFTVEEALTRLLAGAPCVWRLKAARSVEITPAPPIAPSPPPPKITVVSEVLVTATKRVQSTERLAVAVSVIGADQLSRTGANDPGSTVGQLAGVLTTNLGPGRDKLLLRGLSDGAFTGRARSTVGTYLDDTPINYNAPDPDLRLVDVERVEVIRGPQGALYGGGSLSGIYRIVTRKPDLMNPSGEARGSVSSTEDGAPSRTLEGYANFPIVAGVAGLRISAYHEVEGGYLDDTRLQRKDVDRTRRDGGRFALSLQPSDTWTMDLAGAIQHLRSDDTHYTTQAMGRVRANRVAEPHENDIGLVTATVRGAWGWAELVSSTGYVRHAYSSTYDASAVVGVYTPPPPAPAPEAGLYSDRTRTEMVVQDLVLTSRGSGRFGWLAGLYASDTSERSPTALEVRYAGRPFVTVDQDLRRDRIREVAVYGEGSYEIAQGWTLALGARLFDIRARTTSEVTSQRFAPRAFQRTADFSGVSPKLSLQRELSSGGLLYAVVSQGYRAGGINSGGANPLPASRETFSPDRLVNYEVGWKARAFRDRLAFRSALFYDRWINIQTDQFRPSGIPYTANVGDAKIAGIEAELTYFWDMGLSLRANTLVSHTRSGRPNPDFAPQLTRGLPSAPDFSGGILAIYEREIGGDLSVRLVGEANYVGRSQVTFDPALARQMGGYLRARLSAGLIARRWEGEIYIINPGDVVSDTFAYGNPFSFGQNRQVTPQRPRTIGVEISRGF